ncbi:MAG: hypothetical protein ACYSUI_00125 [Planctomycetota bacterium]|jgi:hypothetical protein
MAVDNNASGLHFKSRRWLVGTNVLLTVLLVIAIVGAVQWGAYRLGGKADWTSSSVNSLSEGTRGLINGLEEQVRITSAYFETDLETEDQAKYRRAVADLTSLYQIENRSRVEIDSFNPLQDHAKNEEVLQRLTAKPKFKEQYARHVELLEAFREEMLPAISRLLASELDETAGLGESLAGRSGSILGQIQLVLTNWQRELSATQEEINDATTGAMPRYSAAINAVRSLYREFSKTLKDIGDAGNRTVAQDPTLPPAQRAYLAGAGERYGEMVQKLDDAVTECNDLPRLDLEDVAAQLAPNSNAIIVETDQDAKVLAFSDVWPPMDPSMASASVAFKDRAFRGEEKISSAILQVTRPEKTAVVFVRHGGPTLFMGGFMPGQPPAPYAQVKIHLEDLNFEVREWDLSKQTEPPEIDPAPVRTIYVVLRPAPQPRDPRMQQQQPPFGPQQRQAILDAVAAGGRVLFLAGWYPGQFGMAAPYEFADYLEDTWGMEVNSGVLLLRAMGIGPGQFRFNRDPITMRENHYGDHVIVERLRVLPAGFPMVCPLDLAPTPPEGVELVELVRCDRRPGLWGVKNIQAYQEQMRNEYQVKVEGDLDGPFTVAAAASKGESKIVVISSQEFCVDRSAFARQAVISAQGIVLRSANPGNLTLLVNSLHWLNDNTEIMNLGQPIDAATLEIAEGSTLSFISVLVRYLWPIAVALCGGAVWYVRRR